LALLNEAALLWDTSSDASLLQKLLQRYHNLGRDAQERSGWRPYSSIRRDLMSVPLVTPHNFQVADEPLIRAELIQLAHENRLDDLLLPAAALLSATRSACCGGGPRPSPRTPWAG
jgi:hypothetical protein